jgi:putative hydrolase of the HAD superfamily
MSRFDVIAFDADDTLWHTEQLYVDSQASFKSLMAPYLDFEMVGERLDEIERRNIQHFGYGIKSFTLSMIETAIELSAGKITGKDIQVIIDMAKRMIASEVQLLEHAAETVAGLSPRYNLMLITKGDLMDQEMKIERSALATYFQSIEIVSEKSPESYARVLRRYRIAPERFLMIGNSLRSDILPVLALGASAVYIPYASTWVHEFADPPSPDHPGYYTLDHIGLLPVLLSKIDADPGLPSLD